VRLLRDRAAKDVVRELKTRAAQDAVCLCLDFRLLFRAPEQQRAKSGMPFVIAALNPNSPPQSRHKSGHRSTAAKSDQRPCRLRRLNRIIDAYALTVGGLSSTVVGRPKFACDDRPEYFAQLCRAPRAESAFKSRLGL
jgi:hypothetical protein